MSQSRSNAADAQAKQLCVELKDFFKFNQILLSTIISSSDLESMQSYIENSQQIVNTAVPEAIKDIAAYHQNVLELLNPLPPIARFIAQAVLNQLNNKAIRLSVFQKNQLNALGDKINVLEAKLVREIEIILHVDVAIEEVNEFGDKISGWTNMLLFPNGNVLELAQNLRQKLENFSVIYQFLWKEIPLTFPAEPQLSNEPFVPAELPSMTKFNKQLETLLTITNDVSLVTKKTRKTVLGIFETINQLISKFEMDLQKTKVALNNNLLVNLQPLSVPHQEKLIQKLKYLYDNIIRKSNLASADKKKIYIDFVQLTELCQETQIKNIEINFYETYKDLSLIALKICMEEVQDSMVELRKYYENDGPMLAKANAIKHKMDEIISFGKQLWGNLIPGEVLLPLKELLEIETWYKEWFKPRIFFVASLIDQKRDYRIKLRDLGLKITNFGDDMARYCEDVLEQKPDDVIKPIAPELRLDIDKQRLEVLSAVITYAEEHELPPQEREDMLIPGCGRLALLLKNDAPKKDFYKEYQKLSIKILIHKFTALFNRVYLNEENVNEENVNEKKHKTPDLAEYFEADAVEILQDWRGLLNILHLSFSEHEYFKITPSAANRRFVHLIPDETADDSWGSASTEEIVAALLYCNTVHLAEDSRILYYAKSSLIKLLRSKHDEIKSFITYPQLRANADLYVKGEMESLQIKTAAETKPDIIKTVADQQFYAQANQKFATIVLTINKYKAKLQKFVEQPAGGDESYALGESLLKQLTQIAEKLTDINLNFQARKNQVRLLLGLFNEAMMARTVELTKIQLETTRYALEDEVRLAKLAEHNVSTRFLMAFGHVTIKEILFEFLTKDAISIAAWLDELQAKDVQASKKPEVVLTNDSYLKVISDIFFHILDAESTDMIDELNKLASQLDNDSVSATATAIVARNEALAHFKEVQEKVLPALLASLTCAPDASQAEKDTIDVLRARVQKFARTLQSDTMELAIKIVDADGLACPTKVSTKSFSLIEVNATDAATLDNIVKELKLQLWRDVKPLLNIEKDKNSNALDVNENLSALITQVTELDVIFKAARDLQDTILNYLKALHDYLQDKSQVNDDNTVANALRQYLKNNYLNIPRWDCSSKSLLDEVDTMQWMIDNIMNLCKSFKLVDEAMQNPVLEKKVVDSQFIPQAYTDTCKQIASIGDEVRNLHNGHNWLAIQYSTQLLTIVGRYRPAAKTQASIVIEQIEEKSSPRLQS